MNVVKYFITDLGYPVLFNSSIIQFEIVSKVISSGFAIINYDTSLNSFSVKCYGEINFLNKNGVTEDYIIIQNYLNRFNNI